MRPHEAKRDDDLLAGSQVVLPSWTLGRAVSDHDRFLPVAPVYPPGDPQVAAAYDGLVVHTTELREAGEVTELAVTAILWRLCSLIDGLEPTPDDAQPNLRRSFIQLLSRHRSRLEENVHRRIDFQLVADLRNAATHIRSGDRTFTEVTDVYATVDDLQDVLHVVTALVASQICDETLDADPPSNAVTAVENDLVWIDDY